MILEKPFLAAGVPCRTIEEATERARQNAATTGNMTYVFQVVRVATKPVPPIVVEEVEIPR